MTLQDHLPPGKYKLRVEDYLRLENSGVFGDAPTELIQGDIIVISPEYRPHAYVKDELQYRLRRTLEDRGSDLRPASGSVSLSDHDMPLPDIILTSEPRGAGAIPLASVALLVEVSSTTLKHDLGRKADVYAVSGVPEYWVVDVNGAKIRQLWHPTDGKYSEHRDVAFGERIDSTTIEGLSIATDTLA